MMMKQMIAILASLMLAGAVAAAQPTSRPTTRPTTHPTSRPSGKLTDDERAEILKRIKIGMTRDEVYKAIGVKPDHASKTIKNRVLETWDKMRIMVSFDGEKAIDIGGMPR